ncbi:DUF2721 domain-containing protein [Dictyobacter aurantiacus]|uniref:DUF2721 domain-containing protein n=1 Tax=Dictyobacter aurantiacus TaxID=1936993 RepID=A0A401Z9N0_9CHLR|nr:DUF2721 domain-containing protein [Dictyobacter aurantiacus]GCE03506.1 hypothetical protein KDAU_08350 [Dictyobacter aurantiacus]
MDIPSLTHIISLIVAPVVMISCCILLLNGQLQRYDSISIRMRSMTQERFELLRSTNMSLDETIGTMDDFCKRRLNEIEAQLPHLLKRHKLLHDAALLIGMAILIFVISMFVLAIAAIQNSDQLAFLSFVTFLGGVTVVWLGGMVILYELNKSHLSVRYEVMHSLSLDKSMPVITLSLPRIAVPREKSGKGLAEFHAR